MRKQILNKFLILFFAIISSLIIGEASLRLTKISIYDRQFPLLVKGLDRAMIKQKDLKLKYNIKRFWENIPGAEGNDDKGFRKCNNIKGNIKEEYRVLFLGDSITYGLDQPADKSYPALVNQLSNGLIESINGGVSGYSSFQGLLQLKEKGLVMKPDAVVVSFYQNDEDNAPYTDKMLYERNVKAYKLDTWIGRVRIYQLISSLFINSDISTKEVLRVPPNQFYNNLAEIAHLSRSIGAKVLFVAQPINPNFLKKQPHLHDFLKSLVNVSKDTDTPLLYVKELSKDGDPQKAQEYFSDHCHLTEKGNYIMARAILKELEKSFNK